MPPIQNDGFKLLGDSDIQDCSEYTINEQKTLTTIPNIHVYINETDQKLVINRRG